MWWFYIFEMVVSVSAGREAYERFGYFWHITDMHYNGHANFRNDAKRNCWRSEYDGGKGKSSRVSTGRYGDYGCDATWELIESAARTMMSRQKDNVEFVLWTGDVLSHAGRHRLNEDRQLELLQNVTDVLSRAFTSHFVFPTLGHDDPIFYKKLGAMWTRWLPPDSMKTFETGGYYIIERKMHKLQIVVLNTNLMGMKEKDQDAADKQWKWLDKVLKKFQRSLETVYLVGHVAPGSNERQRSQHSSDHAYSDYHNKKYLEIVRKYAGIIAGQFFGHLHSDTFRVIYEENGRPVSWAMLAPSVTPRRSDDGFKNPALRLYKFDRDTGQVYDYTQYYLDLSWANSENSRTAEWQVEYNFSTYYAINEINAVNLHTLADKLTQHYPRENSVFDRYYRANDVRISPTASGCDATCAHTHYCAITKVDYGDFHQCLKTPASALSASRSLIRIPRVYLVFVLSVAVLDFVR